MLILFWIYKSRINSAGQAPLMMRITINGRRIAFSTNIFVDPADFDQDKQKIRGKSPLSQEINTALLNLTTNAWSIYNDLQKREITVSSEAIRDGLNSRNKTYNTLLQAVAYVIENMRARLGHDITPGTLKKYLTVHTKIKSFLGHTLAKNDISLHELNYKFVTEFDLYMRTQEHLKHNAVVKNMQQLRHIVKECLKNDWLKKDPFIDYKCKIVETDRGYLTAAELARIEQCNLPSRSLEQVRDIFVFCCYTGLAYADVSKLSRFHLEKGEDGIEWIKINRTKTLSKSLIPILPKAREIIEKYSYQSWGLLGVLLPVISNQNLNKYLKKIGEICGISKRLSMHLARHTFATTVTLEKGVPITTVSKMMGHKRLSTTQIYAKITDVKIAQDMKEFL